MSNYLTYPCKHMRITQTYTGTTSHLPHTTGSPKDYPIDEGCSDTGRDWMYCPCDEMKITRIYGIGSSGTNTVWLQSTSKVDFADGTSDYFSMLVIHPDDSDISGLSVGQKFTRGEKICMEGSDGATGNHFHFAFGKGTITGTGWTKNSSSKWVLTVSSGTEKPEELFFIDKDFTTVMSMNGLDFKYLDDNSSSSNSSSSSTSTSSSSYSLGNYEVTASVLNVRTGPSTSYSKRTYSQMTSSAQTQILNLAGYKANGYVKGLVFTALEIEGSWAKTPSGWVSLEYCKTA
ncbi:MAG: hypothetical protein R3Y27_08920 [Clostridia bacterium]